MKNTLNYHDSEFLAYFAKCFLYAAYFLESFKLRTGHSCLHTSMWNQNTESSIYLLYAEETEATLNKSMVVLQSNICISTRNLNVFSFQ